MGPKRRATKLNSTPEQPSNFDKKVEDLKNFNQGKRRVKKTAHPKLPKYRKRHGVHDMTNPCRGRCLIIANHSFKRNNTVDSTLNLNGYIVDSQILEKIFNQLYFQVRVELNQTVEQMKDLLQSESNSNSEESPNAFVVFILSHGSEHGVSGSDFDNSNTLTERDIIEVLHNGNCHALQDRPKLIFIQACHGVEGDTGVLRGKRGRTSDQNSNGNSSGHGIPANTHPFFNVSDVTLPEDVGESDSNGIDMDSEDSLIPTVSETMICYSTVFGYLSLVNPYKGSVFGVSLAWALMNSAHDTDLQALLNLISADMKEAIMPTTNGSLKQIPEVRYKGWTKKLYFNPGYPKIPNDKKLTNKKKSEVQTPDSTEATPVSIPVQEDDTNIQQEVIETIKKVGRKRKSQNGNETPVKQKKGKKKATTPAVKPGQPLITDYLSPSPKAGKTETPSSSSEQNISLINGTQSGKEVPDPKIAKAKRKVVQVTPEETKTPNTKPNHHKKAKKNIGAKNESSRDAINKDRPVIPLSEGESSSSDKCVVNSSKNNIKSIPDLSQFKRGELMLPKLSSKKTK